MSISRSKMQEMLKASRKKLVEDVADILMAADMPKRDPDALAFITDEFDGDSLWFDILDNWDENYES